MKSKQSKQIQFKELEYKFFNKRTGKNDSRKSGYYYPEDKPVISVFKRRFSGFHCPPSKMI